MAIDPKTMRRFSWLGLLDLNQSKGWGTNFHEGFKDLNPILNPGYKFLNRKLSRKIAEETINKLGLQLFENIEE